jgi:hypothetical protein
MNAPLRSPRKTAPAASMTKDEYGRLLNVLLESERAGAKLLSAYCDELPLESDAWAVLRAIQQDEARNCAVLIHLLLEEGVTPSASVGAFYEKGLGIPASSERLRFLNRGQQWVADRIADALPRVPDRAGRKALQAMYESHLANIDLCKEQMT